jgi:alpha-L-fucosidase
LGKVVRSLTDHELSSFVALKDHQPYVFDFKERISFDRISLQENIAEGQPNAEALLEYWDGKIWKNTFNHNK